MERVCSAPSAPSRSCSSVQAASARPVPSEWGEPGGTNGTWAGVFACEHPGSKCRCPACTSACSCDSEQRAKTPLTIRVSMYLDSHACPALVPAPPLGRGQGAGEVGEECRSC